MTQSAAFVLKQSVAQHQAGGSPGVIWALLFSLGTGWLIATVAVQFGSMLRWLDERSRNPGPPPRWLRRLVRAIRRPQATSASAASHSDMEENP